MTNIDHTTDLTTHPTITFPTELSNMELAYLAVDNDLTVRFDWTTYETDEKIGLSGPDVERFIELYDAAVGTWTPIT